MNTGRVASWQVAAAAFFGGLCLFLTWDWQQVPPPDPSPTQAVSTGIPTTYGVLTRTEIMLSAAGGILN